MAGNYTLQASGVNYTTRCENGWTRIIDRNRISRARLSFA